MRGQIGAGFPVTGREVVTCAQVIADSGVAPVTVTFPHQAGEAAVPARILSHGGWGGRPTDPGDLAVLELDEARRSTRPPSPRPAQRSASRRASSSRTASRAATTKGRSPNTGPPPPG
ncbi:hypothetical protein [Streptomyces sp. NPDC055134]